MSILVTWQHATASSLLSCLEGAWQRTTLLLHSSDLEEAAASILAPWPKTQKGQQPLENLGKDMTNVRYLP